MKHKLLNKLLTLTLLILGGALFSPAWGEETEVTFDFENKDNYTINTSKSSISYGEVATFSYSVTGTDNCQKQNGLQWGASKVDAGTITITTSTYSSYVIKQVDINATSTAGYNATVKVGSTSYTGDSGNSAFGTTAHTNTYTGSSSGNLEITLSQSSTKKNINIKSIVIKYEEQTPTHTLTYSAANGSISGVVYGTSTAVTSGASIEQGGKVTLTATPSDGYEFSSWSVEGTGSSLSSTTDNTTTFTMGTADATVTANFTATGGTTTYNVTYNANGATSGDVPEDDNDYDENVEVTVLGNTGGLAKTGYAFGGWNTQADGSGTDRAAGSTFNITGNTTLYAKWTPYTITAQSNNNSYGTVSLEGYVITGNPETGYRYASPAYTIDPANSASVVQNGDEFTITPSANTTVTINFEAIPTHTATFSVNGNTTAQKFVEGASIIFPSDPADISEKKFVGWYTAEYTHASTAPTFVNKATATMGNSDITYYAVYADVTGITEESWTETTIDQISSSDVIVISNGSYAMNNNNGTSSAPGTNSIYVSGTNLSKTPADNLKWNVSGNSTDGYTFYPNGTRTTWLYCTTTASTGSNNNIRVGTGDRKVWGVNDKGYLVTKDTYTTRYLSIYNDQDFRGYITKDNGAFVPKFYKHIAATATYANYCTSVVITYSVTYDANGATSGSVPTDATAYSPNATVTVLGNTGNLAKTGCAFSGWNTKSDGSGDNYDEDDTFEITANTTLYAKWVPYEITAVSNNESYGTVSREGLVITGSPKSGYRYASPAYSVTSGSATVAQEDNEFTVTPASDCTVQINFEEIPTHTVTVTGTGGTITVKYGDDTIDSGSSVREETVLTIIAEAGVGKIFKEWKLTGATPVDKDAATTTFTMGTENVTIEAVYDDAVTHAITYSVNGITTTVNVIEGEDVDLSAPTSGVPTGYAFKGWRTSTLAVTDTDPDDYITSATSTADITYYAVLAIETPGTGTWTLDYTEENASGKSVKDDITLNYGSAVDYTAADGSAWLIKAYKNSGMQINKNKNSSIKVPSCSGKITSIAMTLNDGAYNIVGFSADDYTGGDIAEVDYLAVAPSAGTSQTIDLSNKNATTGYIVPNGGNAQITQIVVTYYKPTFSGYCTTIPPVAVTVTASNYATFASDFPLDFTGKEIKAYIAKAKNDGSGVTFERKYKIPAGTGVLLYKDGGATEYIPVTTESTDDVTYNVFVRGTGENVASVVGNMYNYILNIVNNVVGFYKAAGNKVAKNRAYIQVESASFAKDFISMPGFDDSTTGVNEVNGSGLMVNGPVYDLQGRRVEKPGKGLYIVNGKKVLKY